MPVPSNTGSMPQSNSLIHNSLRISPESTSGQKRPDSEPEAAEAAGAGAVTDRARTADIAVRPPPSIRPSM